MLFDVLDYVFLLDFTLKTAKCTFYRLTILHLDFSQPGSPPLSPAFRSETTNQKSMLGYHRDAVILD